jgi:hypothetical protein
MRNVTVGILAGCLAVVAALGTRGAAALAEDKEEGFTPLFNGKDLKGFKTFLQGKADPKKTWSVKEGVIICTGKPMGYFYTQKSYKDYVLRYDWRYPEGSKPDSNSGCLVHIQDPGKPFGSKSVWPKCVEPQGRYHDHGKLFFMGVKPIEQKFDAKAQKKALRPMGEWSTTQITCKADGSISVKLNGVAVSSGKSELKEGPIGWQSEGAEVHFRKIRIKTGK